MKPTTKSPLRRALPWCALTLLSAGSAFAQTLLFSDNFNTARLGDGNFNNDIATDQSGTAATQTYTTSLGGGWDGSYQRGNGGAWLMYAGNDGSGNFGSTNMAGSLNYDIAAAANTANSPLEIKFNMSVSGWDGNNNFDWTSFTVGGGQNPFVNSASVGFSSLFRDNGGTQQFSNGADLGASPYSNPAPSFTDGQVITFVFSDAAGTGSAFNSDGPTDVVKMYVNGSLTNTFTGLDLDATDQYISFNARHTIAHIDNLTITATAADPFATWMSTNYPAIVAPDNQPGADPDHDGIPNLMEYVLQGGDPSASSTAILPKSVTTATDFVFTYYRRAAATGTTQTFEYGDTLSGWTPVAIPGGAGVTVTPNTPSAGIDKVEISVAKGAYTELFGRLQVVK